MNEQLSPTEQDLISEGELSPVYQDSEITQMLEAQKSAGDVPAALFTDIDDTAYIPDDPEASQALFNEAKERNFPLIADTGGQFQVVKARIDSGELPPFQVICSSVGTQIRVLTNKMDAGKKVYKLDEEYRDKLLASGYDRKAVVRLASEEVENYVKSSPDLKLDFQWPAEEKSFLEGAPCLENQEFKTSLQFETDDAKRALEVKERFISLFPQFKVSVCEASEREGLHYLDILAADKVDAINYLCSKLGIEAGMIAGDSGNDIAMLTKSGESFYSVLVGGHKAEAFNAVSSIASEPGVTGKGSFRRVPTESGTKLYYLEKGNLKGPNSIIQAAKMILRAANIEKIRRQKEVDLRKSEQIEEK